MRTEHTAGEDTPTAALLRECAAKTVDALLAELRRRPIVQPEWLSLQDAAAYTGYSEQQFSDFVKRGVAPMGVLFSCNARRFKRSDVDAWCAAGGPSAYKAGAVSDADSMHSRPSSRRGCGQRSATAPWPGQRPALPVHHAKKSSAALGAHAPHAPTDKAINVPARNRERADVRDPSARRGCGQQSPSTP